MFQIFKKIVSSSLAILIPQFHEIQTTTFFSPLGIAMSPAGLCFTDVTFLNVAPVIMEDSLPRTPLNHSAKFDAASIILAREIQTQNTQKTNSK